MDKQRKDQMIQDQGLPAIPESQDGTYSIEFGFVVFSNSNHGAILMEDEMWHPFRYFDDGEWDISDDKFYKPSSAFKIAALTYT